MAPVPTKKRNQKKNASRPTKITNHPHPRVQNGKKKNNNPNQPSPPPNHLGNKTKKTTPPPTPTKTNNPPVFLLGANGPPFRRGGTTKHFSPNQGWKKLWDPPPTKNPNPQFPLGYQKNQKPFPPAMYPTPKVWGSLWGRRWGSPKTPPPHGRRPQNPPQTKTMLVLRPRGDSPPLN